MRAKPRRESEYRTGAGVQSVQLAIDVLEAIAFSDEELGVTQIAERLSVTKGSVHRHLTTLVERGYLAQNPVTQRYMLGPKSRILARLAPETDLVNIADGPMRVLRDALGHSVVLSAATSRGALVVTTIAGTSPIEIGVRVGSELSLAASAQGRLILAHGGAELRSRALSRPIEKHTVRTMTDVRQLKAEFERIVRQGYAVAPEQMMVGINAVAAPLFDATGACIGAVAIVGSIQNLPANPDARTISALKMAAEQVSMRFGYGKAAAHAPQELVQRRRRSG